jgi:predicted porin
MKKIIAAAVATALVAPAFAADVSVSGTTIFNYITDDRATKGDKVATDDQAITVKATQELSNGMTVTSAFNLVHDGTGNDLDNQGSNLAVSGAFGTVAIGDVSGALDATGDWTDVSPIFGGYALDGDDMNMAWTLPTIIPNLTLAVSYSPDGANLAGDEPFSTEGEGGSAYSATYSSGAFAVYFGAEKYDEAATQEAATQSYGIKYTSGPIYVAIEAGSADDIDQTAFGTAHASNITNKDMKFMGIAGKYSMGDLTLGFEKQEAEEKGASANTKRLDETTIFVSQSLGNGVDVYAATSTDEGGPADTDVTRQAVGIKFAF